MCRVQQHKDKSVAGFTAKYNISRLAYFAQFNDPRDAIEHEKKLKGWARAKKITLVEESNPKWEDLAADWFDVAEPAPDDLSLE